jgi:hypothetical protein
VPANGAASTRTQVDVVTCLAASENVRAGPARATVRAPSVNVATQAPVELRTTLRAGAAARVTV